MNSDPDILPLILNAGVRCADSMHFYEVLLGVLAVWRITHLISEEDGPWNLCARLRRALGQGFWAGLFNCFYCLSLWISVPFSIWLGFSIREMALLWPALSGAAILLERMTTKADSPPAAVYYEEHEGDK